MNLAVSFVSSLFLIYALYYSVFAQNNLLAIVIALTILAIVPYTVKNLTSEKAKFFFLDLRAIFASLLLLEVSYLSYNYVLPDYREKLGQAYLYFFISAAFFFILYFKENLELFLSKHRLKGKLILLISFAFSFYLWGGNLNANWGITGDHMIMHYFIDNPQVSFLEVPKLIVEKTEVGKFGDTTINRPFYYSGRVIESALWQMNVSLWYLARIVMFSIAFFLFWLLLERWLGFFYSGIFMFFVALSSYWAWIWGYLDPAENYAMFGSALFLVGFFNLVSRIKKKKIDQKVILVNSTVLLLGSLIAIGAKENFLILVFPLLYLAFLLFKGKIKSLFLIVSLAAIFIYSVSIATGIYLGLTKAGGDVYGQDIGILERLRLTLENLAVTFEEINLIGIFAAILFAFAAIFLTKSNTHLDKYKVVIKNFFLVSLVLIALYASQVFFYNGGFPPTSLRYSFPGMLAIPLFWLAALTTLFSILEIIGVSRFMIKQTKNAIFAGLLVLILLNGYQEARAFVASNVAVTNSFAEKMESFYDFLEKSSTEPVVFDSYSVWNVEPIASIRAYLLANNRKNPMFLRLNFSPIIESNSDKIAYKIYYFLSHISNNGGCGFTGAEYTFLSGGDCDQWGFEPIAQLKGDYFTIKIDEQNKISGSEEDN